MRTGTLIVGAGQAGLALSRFLTSLECEHAVLERGRMGERWRSERWDSLALLTPNWFNRLPEAPLAAEPDGFLTGRAFADELERYAASFAAPVHERTTVARVSASGGGFAVETDAGTWHAANVVVATGHADLPLIPPVAAGVPDGIAHLHASRYRSPEQLPDGGALVVGAGPSGQQIALELRRAGRNVTISAGRHARVPRTYRGRDLWCWLRALGHLERTRDQLRRPEAALRSPSLPLDGRDGGRRLDLEVLARAGVTLAGRLEGFTGGRARFTGDLPANVAAAERRLRSLLDSIDAHPAAAGAPRAEPLPEVPVEDVPEGLALEGLGAIIWATGYRRAYPWLDVPVLDERGELAHERGVTAVPGLYALGLRWQHRLTSHQIGGVGRDAAYLAARIAARERRGAERAA